MLSTAIFTAPRSPCYLGNSLDSYFRFWDITPHVFAEPDTWTGCQHTDRVVWHMHQQQKGCTFNWFEALTWMYTFTDTPYIMICEDDIEWRPGASEELRTILNQGWADTQFGRIKLEDVAFISPYCSARNQHELGPRDQWVTPRMKVSGWCGALAICLTREFARYIMSNASAFMWYNCYKTHNKRVLHLDHAIGRMALDSGKQILTHNPTLVLHTGDTSTFQQNNESTIKYCSSRMPAL